MRLNRSWFTIENLCLVLFQPMIQCRCSATMVTLPHFLVCIYRNSFKKMQCDCLNWMGCCTSRKAKDHGKNITLFWGLQESIIHLKEKLRLAFIIFKYFKKTVFFSTKPPYSLPLFFLSPFLFPEIILMYIHDLLKKMF